MKNTFIGSGNHENWYGLKINVNLNPNYTTIIETVSWEVWKLTVITPAGCVNKSILRKYGNEQPSIHLYRRLRNRLHGKHEYTIASNGLIVEDCEEK